MQYTPPPSLAHQAEDYDRARDMPGWARFWEQGTGKSKPTVDEQVYHLGLGTVDCCLTFAPNGVHSNWVNNEWPTWLDGDMFERVSLLEYNTEYADTRWHQKAVADCLYGKRIPMVAMSYDALMTAGGLKLAQHLLKRRRCFLTGDEAHRFKDPSTKRTKRVLAAAKWAPIRRILTGTPILESPFNAYTLMRFIDENYWLPYRLSTYTTFKAMFGQFGKGFLDPNSPTARRMRAQGEMDLSNFQGYQHLDLLQDALSSHSSRYLKDDVLDLPPKLYTFRTHRLSTVQQRVYDEIKDQLVADLDDGTVTTKMALTQLLRLQQITSGHVPLDDGTLRVFDPNPRLKLMREVQQDIPHRHIVFNRFTEDVDINMALAAKNGLRAVRYDGRDGPRERNEAVERFQDLPREDPQAYDVIVANTDALAEGRTLTEAKTVVYYSNGWSAIKRQQSEDRPHRIGQTGAPLEGLDGGHGVLYVDLMCPGTPDEKIVRGYRKKQSISEKVLGDNPKDWL